MALSPIEVVHDVAVDVVVHTVSKREMLGIRDERHPEVWRPFWQALRSLGRRAGRRL
jgi:hypothetical protein